MAENMGFAFDWDSEIEKDSGDFILLREGDYEFEVVNFERKHHDGSAKLPPCPKAVITLRVDGVDDQGNEGSTLITHNLFLHSSCEGLISGFFVGIGRKKKGEKLRMDWSNLIGQRGYARVGVRSWVSEKDGETKYNNEIKKFYAPEDAALLKAKNMQHNPAPAAAAASYRGNPLNAAPSFTAGNF